MGQKKKVSRRAGSFSVEFRIRVVKLFIEEGYSISMLAEEFGCGKSTLKVYREQGESGLEQEYNSLNAQREAAENYIASQKLKGWKLVLKKYDDGGFREAICNDRREFVAK